MSGLSQPLPSPNRKPIRRGGVVAVMLMTAACEQSAGTPAAPTPAQVSLSGVVVSTQDGSPVPGASIWVRGFDDVNRVTGPDGRFTLVEPRTSSGQLQIWMAAGRVPEFDDLVYREVSLSLLTSRDALRIDVIRDEPPFSLPFYEELVRNARDGSGTLATRPWTIDPSFHIRTTHVETGDAIPVSILDDLEQLLRRSVPLLSGGRRQVSAVVRSPDAGPDRDGWVNVLFQSVLPNPTAGGQATVGGNRGTMWLRFDPANPRLPPGNGVACASVIGTADHEIVHTMGFWHVHPVPGVPRPFQSLDFCTGEARPDIVRYHAAIMYSRPPGNLPPDRDPSSITYSQAAAAGAGPIIACASGEIAGGVR
jgi:hypothetical protein